MKVRKKQSKRTSTRMREGIKKKAAAQHRKERKHAKKDVTWKSNKKKDPGIPANFPYKNKILEAIEVRRQQDLEEKEIKKQNRLEAKRRAAENGEELMDDDSDDDSDGGNGLTALVESAQQAAAEYEGSVSAPDANDEEDQEVVEYDIDFFADSDSADDASATSELDRSRKAYDKIFKTVVDAADVILYVLDARDPEGTRSRKVEEAVLQNPGKRLLFILNKVDLIPPFVLEQWMTFLKSSFPTIPLRAAPGATNASSFNRKLTQGGTANALIECLKTYANNSKFKRSIVVGVIGYPNVGKSSVINALTSRRGGSSKACPVGNQAGVTTSLREVKVDNKLKILDSPGICFPSENSKKSKKERDAELALLSALPQKHIVDSYPAVLMMVKRLSKSDEMTEAFKQLYQLPPIPAPDADSFTKQFLIHVARKRGRIGKGGVPNLNSAGLSVLNDWRDGKILAWVLPNSSKESSKSAATAAQPSASGSSKPLQNAEQAAIVSEWSKEFDLDGLFASLDSAIASDRK
ncbi:LAFA_0D08416g1_1 [Lachancea sp. 'fantastica']|nr:LAFA_0D08416g1_1 [Lachancea sp. 'fantastica']